LRVILNFGDAPLAISSEIGEILAATHPHATSGQANKLMQLGAAEGIIVRLRN
jgi:hypothetical protein